MSSTNPVDPHLISTYREAPAAWGIPTCLREEGLTRNRNCIIIGLDILIPEPGGLLQEIQLVYGGIPTTWATGMATWGTTRGHGWIRGGRMR